jgi:hypothetical protein
MVEQLKGFVATDLTAAVSYLTQVIKTLEAYKEIVPTASAAQPDPSATETKAAS